MIAIFPEITAAAESGRIEDLSILVRRYFLKGGATSPSIDVAALVDQFGLPVSRLRMKERGLIAVRDENGVFRCHLVINESIKGVEESFLLAHLLGHFLLHIQPKLARSEWSASGYRDQDSPLERYTHTSAAAELNAKQFAIEDLADRFAAALLMPKAMIVRASEKLVDDARIASIFSVTPALVMRRLEDIDSTDLPPKITIRPSATSKKTPLSAPKQVLNNPGQSETIISRSANEGGRTPADTAHMVREKHHLAPPTPRAIVAQSYESQSLPQKAPTAPQDGPSDSPPSPKGMDRLRQIARMLDKTSRE
jgi:Zn-dependent peptidase ImmA (M78 family)